MSKVEIIDDCILGSLEELQRIKREITQEHTIVYESEIIPFSIHISRLNNLSALFKKLNKRKRNEIKGY